ncbi:MAG TPA: TonB family protein [Bryobacteraceae bacterium]|jgi:TonB family protein
MNRAACGLLSLTLLIRIGSAFPADGDTEVYRPGPGVSAPKVIRKIEPRYTQQARRAFVQGTVVLEVVVGESGSPERIATISPIGFGLDDRAQEAVSQWVFKPGKKDGKPVKTITTVTVDFRIFHRVFDPAAEERRTSYNLVVEEIQNHRRSDKTLETIQNLAQQKYPPAMYLYAKMLEAGDGFPRDPDQAVRLIVEAAQKNFAAAMYDEGRMLLEGRRLPQDPDKGLELVRNAAILRNRPAQFYLAGAYERGDGLPQSPEQARQYYRLCAVLGESICQVRLAKLLLDKPEHEERDRLQAIAWLELADEKGDPLARVWLDAERSGLTDEQLDWVKRLKEQFLSMR